MRIALNIGGHHHDLDTIRSCALEAAEDGLTGVWMSQIFGPDALTCLAVIGQHVEGLELGVSIVPIYGRHPLALAIQARTTQAATGGRLTLGIGPSHRFVVEACYGDSYAKPYTHTVEYLDALQPLLAGEAADVDGDEITARGQLTIDAPCPPPLLLAGLGPRMLTLAGSRTSGTTLWMVGPATIAERITPAVTAAATRVGRDAPRILAGITAVVTDDPGAARARAAQDQGIYSGLPAYQRMLTAEGVDGPEDLVIAGDEAEVVAGISRYADAGATDVRVTIMASTPDEHERTRAVLRHLAETDRTDPAPASR